MKKIFKDEKTPVSVYDVEDKKLVMIFDSISLVGRYFNLPAKTIQSYLRTKSRLHKNRFLRTVCFRKSTNEQLKLIGNSGYDILDDRYKELPILTMGEHMKDDKRQFTQEQIIKYSKINLNSVL